MCAITYLHVCHNCGYSLMQINVTMSPPSEYVWHGPLTCVTWLIYMCDMTQPPSEYVRHGPLTCVIWLVHAHSCQMRLSTHADQCNRRPNMCDMTHSREMSFCAHADQYMGWLRLVGFLKLYFYFAKETYKRDDILQKRLMILRSLLNVATPYSSTAWHDSVMCVTYRIIVWHIHVCDVTHSCESHVKLPCVSHSTSICVTWLVHMWYMTQCCVRHDSCIFETWRIHVWQSHQSCHMYESVMSHVYLSPVTEQKLVMSHNNLFFDVMCIFFW